MNVHVVHLPTPSETSICLKPRIHTNLRMLINMVTAHLCYLVPFLSTRPQIRDWAPCSPSIYLVGSCIGPSGSCSLYANIIVSAHSAKQYYCSPNVCRVHPPLNTPSGIKLPLPLRKASVSRNKDPLQFASKNKLPSRVLSEERFFYISDIFFFFFFFCYLNIIRL